MGVHPGGADIMARKGVHRVILLRNVANPVAQIVKQELLAVGGDAALPAASPVGGKEIKVNLLMATDRQLDRLLSKLRVMASREWSFSQDVRDLLGVVEGLLEVGR